MGTRTALVTGASRGLGFALAKHLAVAGWNVVVDARNAPDLANAAAALQAGASGLVLAIPGDVSDPKHAAAIAGAADRLGNYSLLVNNASALGPSPLPKLVRYPIADLERVLAVNVVAPLRLIQLSLPALRVARGTILNVTSDAATEPYRGWGGYGSSKAALEQISNVLAVEEPGVRVLWIDPGDMATRMHQDAFPGEDISDRPTPTERIPAFAAILEGDLPSGRYRAGDLLTAAGSTA